MPYAKGTTVTVEKSRAQIERLISSYGAAKFTSGWDGEKALIMFEAHNRVVKFVLRLPTIQDVPSRAARAWGERDSMARKKQWLDAEVRRRWRSLLLAIKAKFEVIETGIATFDQEFLAHIVTPNNQTVYERLATMGHPMLPALPAMEENECATGS